MAYKHPFQLLKSDEIQLIISSAKFRTAYVNCLALLQGVLVPFGSRPGFSTFDNLGLVEESVNESLDELPPQIAAKMKTNRDTALDLRRESITSEVTSRLGLVKVVDDFLEAIVIQYQILRSAGSQPLPKVMGANAN